MIVNGGVLVGVAALSPWHLLIVAFVFVLLFGAKKLPDAACSVGRSLRIFQVERQGVREDEPPARALTSTTLPPTGRRDGQSRAAAPGQTKHQQRSG